MVENEYIKKQLWNKIVFDELNSFSFWADLHAALLALAVKYVSRVSGDNYSIMCEAYRLRTLSKFNMFITAIYNEKAIQTRSGAFYIPSTSYHFTSVRSTPQQTSLICLVLHNTRNSLKLTWTNSLQQNARSSTPSSSATNSWKACGPWWSARYWPASLPSTSSGWKTPSPCCTPSTGTGCMSPIWESLRLLSRYRPCRGTTPGTTRVWWRLERRRRRLRLSWQSKVSLYFKYLEKIMYN